MYAKRGVLIVLSLVGAAGWLLGTGQEAEAFIRRPKLPIVSPGHHYHVEYRNLDWDEKTFFGPAGHSRAHAFENRMRGLGFRTELEHHGIHYHVKYRLPQWRQKTFSDHGAAHAFADWLQDLHVQTKIEHH